jgi:capsular polysaccharide biosynthesis protein
MDYVKKLPFLAGISFIVTLFLFGGYLWCKAATYLPTFQAISTYYVDYGVDPSVGDAYTYINAYSWNVWIHTDEMLEEIESHLSEPIDEDELEGYLFADLPGDLRMPITKVTTTDEALSLTIAHAVEEAMMAFGYKQKEINSIRVVDSPVDTMQVPMLEEPAKIIGLCALLAIGIVSLCYLGIRRLSDGIWSPQALAARCKLPVLGTQDSPGLGEHLRYYFGDAHTVGITTVTDCADPVQIRQTLYSATGVEAVKDWVPILDVTEHPKSCSELRKMDAVLLTVPAGKKMGRKVAYILSYLALQDCKITAVILWNKERKHRLLSRDGLAK